MNNRYQELKKQNNEILSHLSGEFQRTGEIYLKKARGYAVRNEDTELKIKDVLEELERYSMEHALYRSVIKSETEYIESNIQKLSKQLNDPDKWKVIIGSAVILILVLGWIYISYTVKKTPKNASPKNVTCTVINSEQIEVTWDKVATATLGYYVWMTDKDGNIYGKFEVLENSYKFSVSSLDEEYTFFVQVKKTDFFKESDEASTKYKP